MSKQTKFESYREMPIRAMTVDNMLWNETGSWRNVKPVYDNKVSPCIYGCPAGENIQHYIQLVIDRKYKEAWETIIETNPMPAVTGRVCSHPCMDKCTRGDYDETVNINAIERALGDMGLDNPEWMTKPEKSKKEKIAVVGSGPAGLTSAFYLARTGYSVTLYEAGETLGGVLRWGIPEYRLPDSVLDRVVEFILSSGKIKVEAGTTVGKDIEFKKLRNNFDAVFLGVGLMKSRQLGIPNEDCKGVEPGLDYLRKVNSGQVSSSSDKAVVIGGGNTAMDVARSALRKGSDVTVVYRRTRTEMPAIASEIEEAEKEGIKFRFLASPKDIVTDGDKLSKVIFQEMELGEPDETGRRSPVPLEGKTFTMDVDRLFTAIGEKGDLDGFKSEVDTEWELIKVKGEFGETGKKKIFAGGDIVTGAASVVEAVAAGRRAAEKIDRVFNNEKDPPIEQEIDFGIENINTDYFPKSKRVLKPRIPASEAIKGFEEIFKGFDEQMLQKEADRCFSCGVCNYCDNCWIYCPDASIIRKDDEYEIDFDFCKGCLVCVEECPRSALSIEEEGK
ncbi:MAG: NAD(P)-binding protein [Candidatus Krumholzibacteriota bacterium]|nr:NAD(P)-binding protein [Candidatus Krumholzibacteriota bacterium]